MWVDRALEAEGKGGLFARVMKGRGTRDGNGKEGAGEGKVE